jgi:hypothetical protein
MGAANSSSNYYAVMNKTGQVHISSLPYTDKSAFRTLFYYVFQVQNLTIKASGLTSTMKPLKATLVWTDPPPSMLATSILVNDLDLSIVGSNGQIFYPNLNAVPDHINNVEQVDAFSSDSL